MMLGVPDAGPPTPSSGSEMNEEPGAQEQDPSQKRILERKGDKVVERLTVKQAGEEIKKLRKAVKTQNKEKLQQEETLKTLTLAVQEMERNTIAVAETKLLTYKALRKGGALHRISYITLSNNVNSRAIRECFYKLIRETLGAEFSGCGKHAAGANMKVAPIGKLNPQVKLFRKEQLALLAENDRLGRQLKDLQKKVDQSRLQREKHEIMQNVMAQLEKDRDDAKMDSGTGDEVRTKIDTDSDTVEVEGELVLRHLDNVASKIRLARLRQLAEGLRRFSLESQTVRCRRLVESETKIVEGTLKLQLARFIRSTVRAFLSVSLSQSFWQLYNNAYWNQPIVSCPACIRTRNEGSRMQAGYAAYRAGTAADATGGSGRGVGSKETQSALGRNDIEGEPLSFRPPPPNSLSRRASPNTGGIKNVSAYLMQPHYYDGLPSTSQNRRSVHFG